MLLCLRFLLPLIPAREAQVPVSACVLAISGEACNPAIITGVCVNCCTDIFGHYSYSGEVNSSENEIRGVMMASAPELGHGGPTP
jgi:hypothetical protein